MMIGINNWSIIMMTRSQFRLLVLIAGSSVATAFIARCGAATGRFQTLAFPCSSSQVFVRLRTTPLSLSGASDENRSSSTTVSSTAAANVQALLDAAAKAREEADRMSRELGRSPLTSTKVASKSIEEVKLSIIPGLLSEKDIDKQIAGWTELKKSNSVNLFGSANLKSFPVDLRMLEQRTGLTPQSLGLLEEENPMVSFDDFRVGTLIVVLGSSVLGVVSLAFLPPNVGATAAYLVALFPIMFLVIGSTSPQIIANAIAAIKSGGKSESANGENSTSMTKIERICRHEAAHFCCGYFAGLTPTRYAVNPQNGVPSVEFAVSSDRNSQLYTPTQVAALTVTAMAGWVGEAQTTPDKTADREGAREDMVQLEQTIFRRSKEFIGAKAQQDLTRWGAYTASLLLQKHAVRFEQVVAAFQQQKPLEECIAMLES